MKNQCPVPKKQRKVDDCPLESKHKELRDKLYGNRLASEALDSVNIDELSKLNSELEKIRRQMAKTFLEIHNCTICKK